MDGDENNLMDTLILNLNERDLCPSFHGIQIQVWEKKPTTTNEKEIEGGISNYLTYR